MRLLTKELERTLPSPRQQERADVGNIVAHAKFFTPAANATWYVTEYDREERTFFGIATLFGTIDTWEFGYVTLDELEGLTLHGAPGVERDLYFRPTPIRELPDQLPDWMREV